jgi:hypothetical protein
LAIRESGVKKIDPKTGDDIALGVTYQITIDERRAIVIQTHVTRDCNERDLNSLFDKVMKVTDRVHAIYRVQELRLDLKREHNQLALSMTNLGQTKERWQTEWQRKGKRGPFEQTGDQSKLEDQMEVQHNRMRDNVKSLEAQIAALERLIGK